MEENFKGKIILAIGAHPDDIDFGCGATISKLASLGAKLYLAVCTDGNRGSRQTVVEKAELIKTRHQEQLNAAKIVGAEEVFFLEEEDGNLISDIKFKEKVVKLIRKLKPDMIFTHDPAWFYHIREDGSATVNHTDHRACGEAVMDAVYPLARDLQSFPDHITEGLEPHTVPELYLFNFYNPTFVFNVTGFVDQKLQALAAHKSQIDDFEEVKKWVIPRHQALGKKHKMKFAEGFTKLTFN
jgi:LmbE family N-acetylglucosaminyl deacetylase